jgi:putative transposase
MRNALAHAGKRQRQMVLVLINTAFAHDDPAAARAQWNTVADQLQPKFPKLTVLLNGAKDDVLAFMDFRSRIANDSHRPVHSSASTPRSNAAPTSSPSFRTKARSYGSSARSYS